MTHRSRSLTDFLLLRAWVEPDGERPLRVVVRRRGMAPTDIGDEQAFADAESAAACVRSWLVGVVRRWEGGERSWPAPRVDVDQGERDRGECDRRERGQ